MQNINHEAFKRAVEFIDSWLAYRFAQLDLIGLSVAIEAGDSRWTNAYGVASRERHETLTTKHRFRLASQTKMLTAVTALQLVQRKKLGLDDPAVRYLPWLDDHHDRRYQKITIRHLLSHTAGLMRDAPDSDFWQQIRPCPTAAEMRAMVLGTDLIHAPGAEPKYSNLGYALLGELIETVSGQSFAACATEHIIRPLGLDASIQDEAADTASRLATGHGLSLYGKRAVFDKVLPVNSFSAAVGLQATPGSMCRFIAALYRGDNRLLPAKLRNEMQHTQARAAGYDAGMAFGLGLDIQTAGGRTLVGHSGHLTGHLSATYADPLRHIAVSVASNSKETPSHIIVRGIFGALNFFLEKSTAKTDLSRFAVRLYNALSTIDIVSNNSRILAADPDDWEPFAWPETLEVIDDTTLRVITPGSTINHGELVHYTFGPAQKIHSVRFAGATLHPMSVPSPSTKK